MLTVMMLLLAPQGPQLGEPVRLKAGDEYIKVEDPGFAAPSFFDTDGDGRKDLVVGQFKDGKIKVYRNLGDGRFDAGKWLQAGGKTAEIPGVW
jgi:hypothetical protein